VLLADMRKENADAAAEVMANAVVLLGSDVADSHLAELDHV
jgi:hypothetical protein